MIKLSLYLVIINSCLLAIKIASKPRAHDIMITSHLDNKKELLTL